MKKILLILSVFAITSCDNTIVKKFGGTRTLNLEKNQKLVNCSWKDDELWILTKPMKSTDSVESYSYQEKSRYGIVEGNYIIQETK